MPNIKFKVHQAKSEVTAGADRIEDTIYTKMKPIGVDYLLCTNLDRPEIWSPSTGTKSYSVIINNEPYEFQRVINKDFEQINSVEDLDDSGIPEEPNLPEEPVEDIYMDNELVPEPEDGMDPLDTQDDLGWSASAVLEKVEATLKEKEVLPNKIARSIRTLSSLIEDNQSLPIIHERTRAALSFEGVAAPIIDEVVGNLEMRVAEPQMDLSGVEAAPQEKPQLMPFVERVTQLRADLEGLQVHFSQDPEKLKAFDDILSACDLINHHILDITEDADTPKETPDETQV